MRPSKRQLNYSGLPSAGVFAPLIVVLRTSPKLRQTAFKAACAHLVALSEFVNHTCEVELVESGGDGATALGPARKRAKYAALTNSDSASAEFGQSKIRARTLSSVDRKLLWPSGAERAKG
eukprot:1572109-Pleurochrysis_carterae.AAC.2